VNARSVLYVVLVAVALAACNDDPASERGGPSIATTLVVTTPSAASTAGIVQAPPVPTAAVPPVVPPTVPASSAALPSATSIAPPPATAGPATLPPLGTLPPALGTVVATAVVTSSGWTPYVVPVADVGGAGWGTTHSEYRATDIFVGCGATIISPVNGSLLEVRRVNAYDPAVDNPATRGGRSVSILGDDGVRYYLAHFEAIADGLEPGVRVSAGDVLGVMGQTGRASACHTHFGISPPCGGKEWSVRRGVVWPYPYLDAWRDGAQTSPRDEVAAWLEANPDACAEAMADPHAGDS
jgi:murein DD-endopeptidase MepM/ murein hydrolase activator NlpD